MHNSPVVTGTKSFDLTSTALLVVAFLAGIASALQTPTFSIFLTDEIRVRPAVMGFSLTGSAVIRILASQFLAGYSGKRGDRKPLIIFCCLLGVLACTPFAWDRSYLALLSVSVFLSSFGSTANPRMFALAREHADKTGHKAVIFNSFLHAQVSLVWVTGPPLACALAVGSSFMVTYLSVAVVFIVYGVVVQLFLPSMQKESPLTIGTVEAPCRNRRDTLLLLVTCTLMQGSNSLYIINTPPLTISELHLPEKLTGVMVGTTAGLKIPTMLIAGYFVKHLDKRFSVRIAVVGNVCFYAGMLMTY